MKLYMREDEEVENWYELYRSRPIAGIPPLLEYMFREHTLRELGYSRKLPKGKQILVVHLTLK